MTKLKKLGLLELLWRAPNQYTKKSLWRMRLDVVLSKGQMPLPIPVEDLLDNDLLDNDLPDDDLPDSEQPDAPPKEPSPALTRARRRRQKAESKRENAIAEQAAENTAEAQDTDAPVEATSETSVDAEDVSLSVEALLSDLLGTNSQIDEGLIRTMNDEAIDFSIDNGNTLVASLMQERERRDRLKAAAEQAQELLDGWASTPDGRLGRGISWFINRLNRE